VNVALVTPKVNLETGGGSHYSLHLYAGALRALDVGVDVYALNHTPVSAVDAFAAVGVPLYDLGGLTRAEQEERLGAVKSDVLFFDTTLPLSGDVKRRYPALRVGAHINTLSGFCTDLARQQDGCWLTCSHARRVLHHAGRPLQRFAYLVRGARTVADLGRGFRSLDGCVFPSPQTVEAYQLYRLDPARCFVVPECLDLDSIGRFRAAPFRSTGGPLTVLYIGTLARYKGMSLLFEALRRVGTPWRVRIYGDGDDRARVLSFAEAFPGRVDYRGHVANARVVAELDGGDFLFVHPCLWFEALGRGILEAMALEIPVVVPDVGGPAWSVRPGVTGLQYRHRDAGDLARQIEWAAEHPADMRRLAAAGREAAKQYDHRRVARLWRDTLARIAETPGTFDA
jgi:glycosyltransferase involved in cell wall biosynthesis